MDAGVVVRTFRARHGLSQSELARRSGVPQPVLSMYENGRRLPSLGTLEAILAVCGEAVQVTATPAAQHDRSVARAIEIHRTVLDKLLTDPETVTARARTQLAVMERSAGVRGEAYIEAWRELLDGPRAELVRVLMSTSERDVELLKMSPFATVLTDRERKEVARRALERRASSS